MGSILVGVGLEREGASQVADRLYQEHGICVRALPPPGLNTLRVSPNLMNTGEEVDRLLGLLSEAGV